VVRKTNPDAPVEVLISFDIDGTLEVGDPPGPVGIAMLRAARQRGYVVGTASDRTRTEQAAIWVRIGLEPDFTTHKHHLTQLREAYPRHRMIHLGDTDIDRYYAELASFEFHLANEMPVPGSAGWVL
jgi:hypothetical protein